MIPKVSVLMPVFNTREDWLRVAVKSVASQTYPNLDLVIADNGSTSASTLNVLKQAKETWPDRVILTSENEKQGTAYALDAALKASDSSTFYYTKLDSDDWAYKDREANRVKLFETLPPQIGGLYDNFFMLNYAPRPHVQPVVLRPYDYRQHVNESYIHGNTMWRASVYDAGVPRSFVYDGYEGKANKHGEDYNYWLQIGDKFDFFWMNCDPAFSWTYRAYPSSKYHADRRGVDYCRTMLQMKAKERRGLL